MSKTRILIVDDDQMQVRIMKAVLEKEGYGVETAFDGKEGLAKARQIKPNLVILDIMMPRMSGEEVCFRLQRDPDTADIPVIFLTAKGRTDGQGQHTWQIARGVQDRLKGYDLGAVEYLTKPVKGKDLIKRVKLALWSSEKGGSLL